MTNPFTLLHPKLYIKPKKKNSFKLINRDFTGSIIWDVDRPNTCSATIFNLLEREPLSGEIILEIGSVIFFTGFINKSWWGTTSLVTSTVNIESLSNYKNVNTFLSKTTFSKGYQLGAVIPTKVDYQLKNNYVFSAIKDSLSDSQRIEALQTRARQIADKEDIGSISRSNEGYFEFEKISKPLVLKNRMHILQKKIELGDMIDIDIIPNINVRVNTTFSLKDFHLDILKGANSSEIPYVVTSSSISFSSRQGAIQKVKAESRKFRDYKGVVI